MELREIKNHIKYGDLTALGKKLGVSRFAVVDVLRGKTQTPRIKTALIALAERRKKQNEDAVDEVIENN